MNEREQHELRLRILVIDPPADVAFQLQRGKSDLVPAVHATPRELAFELTVRVGAQPDGQPNFLGPFAQGTPADRFVYVNSGTLAGQADSPWTRRAKIKLAGITREMIERARTDDRIIEARIAGTGRDGGPACATVPIVGGWSLADRVMP
jgi:hypothetical protein